MTELPRILFDGGTELTRRLRMTMRVVSELRRRRWKFSAVSCGDLADDFIRGTPPDEIHCALSPAELDTLFRSCSIVLETSDQPDMLSPAVARAAALGLPAICHRGAQVATASVMAVDEWSADAFADAIMTADLSRRVP